jgi:hydroxyethylthiazole kinase-like uncharacterized protein yjeF
MRDRHALLTVPEMYRADTLTMAGGIPGETLMESAGTAVAREIASRWAPQPTVVLCGPGNNGGDGFVVARLLAQAGWPVRLGLLGSIEGLRGDAAGAAACWSGPVELLSIDLLDGAVLVVDALFGAGLARPLDGLARAAIESMTARGVTVIAIDVPSGVQGDTGAVLGAAPRAALTVTFFRRKPGHVLLPGRLHAGTVVVADIGIPDNVLDDIRPMLHENDPDLWLPRFPWPRSESHKYSRGHCVILGGSRMTGAARLAARAAMRAGAGLVTIACPPESFAIYAAAEPGNIVHPLEQESDFSTLLSDHRRNAVLIGPGAGVSAVTRTRVLTALKADKNLVLDADALSAFADQPASLFQRLSDRCLLTPHAGEFKRLFGIEGDKLSQARRAAQRAGAVVLLKGADTVIAGPDGRAVINANAPPELATAGAGDVLAGLALGLTAQGMTAFDAGCAAAWLHGAAADEIGPGLIAEDLPDLLPIVLRRLRQHPVRTA